MAIPESVKRAAFPAVLTWFALLVSTRYVSASERGPATLEPVRPLQCAPSAGACGEFDAVVFVHGIYGGNDTFKSTSSGFDWPMEFPSEIEGRRIDVFRLIYQTELMSWAEADNPSFDEVAKAVLGTMKPLRKRQYRSIGFIAHSLGGNVVSTYIHMVKTKLGHPQRSQHAFVITLATPVLGAQIAELGSPLKRLLGMNDGLLDSLTRGNLYLVILNQFRVLEDEKERRYVCRSVHLHAAFEERYLGPLLIVTRDSAAEAISSLAKSPVVGFRLNHSEIAKPTSPDHEVYKWVRDRIVDEFRRIATWDEAHRQSPPSRRLCEEMDFKPEQ